MIRCRRLPRRALAGHLRRRVEVFLMTVKRPRRFAEVAAAPGVEWARQGEIFGALRALVDRGSVRWSCVAKLGRRGGFPSGSLFPLFWHRIWAFDHLEPAAGDGGGDHG